ncbi:MAG: hypothetical protein GXX99_05795 [Clostridiales bacterium]|nr:hypothetical protein [Clostridiales bacterium]
MKSNRGRRQPDEDFVKRTLQEVEQNLGPEASATLRKLGDPKDLERMLKNLSERDMARLEQLLGDPKRLRSLLTEDNIGKIKEILGE